MPTTWRVHVIEERLEREGIHAVVDTMDVYSLSGDMRRAVVDVLVGKQATFPMVVVGDAVVSHDGVDLDAVVCAARERLADVDCC